jgi:pimeloyl-ACP methyl ester carboxylesterase
MRSRTVEVDGFTWNIHDEGAGPAVVLCHGFPGLGYSYRHQVAALTAAGYRAVAPDMPGYGRTDRPVAWTTALRHTERVAGLVLLAVPYAPDRMPARPTDLFAAMARRHFLHLHYFQEPSVAERELDPRAHEFIQRLFFALSGAYRYLEIRNHPSDDNGYLDVLPQAPDLPWDWLTAEELEHYGTEFTRTGFAGGLSWYRAYDANWEVSAEYEGAVVEVPTLFVAGASDPVLTMSGPGALDRMRQTVPDLRGIHLLERAGHFVQMERRAHVDDHLLTFVSDVLPSKRTVQ